MLYKNNKDFYNKWCGSTVNNDFDVCFKVIRSTSGTSHLWHQRSGHVVDDVRFDTVGFGPLVEGQPAPAPSLVPIGQRPIVPWQGRGKEDRYFFSDCWKMITQPTSQKRRFVTELYVRSMNYLTWILKDLVFTLLHLATPFPSTRAPGCGCSDTDLRSRSVTVLAWRGAPGVA